MEYNVESVESVGAQLKREKNLPLDYSSIFNSYVDAIRYINGTRSVHDERNLYKTCYVGQLISVYEDGVVHTYKVVESLTEGGMRDLAEITEQIDCGTY